MDIPSKPASRSRIIWLNALTAGAGALLTMPDDLPRWVVVTLTVTVAMLNVVLRYDTDTEIQ